MLYSRYILQNAWKQYRHQWAGTGMGFFWNILKPLLQVLIYWVVFSRLIIRTSASSGLDYFIYICSGILPWYVFTGAIQSGTATLQEYSAVLNHSRIPGKIFVAINTLKSGIDLALFFCILIVITLAVGIPPGLAVLSLPLIWFLFLVMIYGVILPLSHLNVLVPDTQQVLQYIIQILFWSLPIVYREEQIPVNWLPVFFMNPLYFFLKSVREIIVFHTVPGIKEWGIMAFWAGIFLALGNLIERKIRSDVRDRII